MIYPADVPDGSLDYTSPMTISLFFRVFSDFYSNNKNFRLFKINDGDGGTFVIKLVVNPSNALQTNIQVEFINTSSPPVLQEESIELNYDTANFAEENWFYL